LMDRILAEDDLHFVSGESTQPIRTSALGKINPVMLV
jgi:hypothetical protein